MKDLEEIAVNHTYNIKEIREGCEIVEKYLKKHKLILYGGQAIDYALRIYNDKIYPDYQIPDYDFYSPNNVVDAFKIMKELIKADLGAVSTMAAIHPKTMRVRLFGVNYVADSSRISNRLYKLNDAVAMNYRGMSIRHPFLQYTDQHRSLSYPFEFTGVQPTVLNRWEKDVERFLKLYQYYPVRGKVMDKFLADLDIELVPEQKGFVRFAPQPKIVYSGLIAYHMYEHLLGKPLPKTIEYISIVVNDKEEGRDISGSSAKTIILPGDMISERMLQDNVEYIIPDEKTGYHSIKGIFVIGISFLIIHFYTLMLIDYERDKPSHNMAMYFRCLEMVAIGIKDNRKEFFPSLKTIGYKKPSKIDRYKMKHGDIPKPPSMNYYPGDDIEEMIKEMPTEYTYDPIYN